MITDYHAKYYALELTKRCSSDSLEKLAASLTDAQVDLNPHQVEAALFAFQSPLSRGAILADEVGLGKTIEAGIVLAQKWAERKRRILIIVPSNLRKQWNQELLEKFFLPSVILEASSYKKNVKDGKANPFIQDEIVICSYHFARSKANDISSVRWDLVVIDEAHRLRNVYKTSNRIARTIKDALNESPKLLLTATPLQNSLLELYGLVSFIDEYTFGDLKSYKDQFAKLSGKDSFEDLKGRLKNICKRTLRRQVLEYVNYTNRIPVTQEFVPTQDEETLYELVSDYLRRENLQALPASQRSLMTLVMRKLLASSTYAITGALFSLENKLAAKLKSIDKDIETEIEDDFETFDELADEWEEDESSDEITPASRNAIENEIRDLRDFRELAESITENAKGNSLLKALKAGFAKAAEMGAKEKAMIFTESRRTQNYLLELLSKTAYGDRVVLFNGSNSDEKSKRIYKEWLEKNKGTDRVTGSKTADMRSALVDYFRDEAVIMIATEAGAEGINLQFCSLVVNYDLPWNPQRIEQRIGRCHRYGQKYDVVVVNFLNKTNAADQRVYELLSEKFELFSGVFGASDEVLGAIESGVDFEKRILRIYQECRTPGDIRNSFDELRKELELQIDETMKQTRKTLLENFDEEVNEKLRMNLSESREYLGRYEKYLWELTKHHLKSNAEFSDHKYEFRLRANPFDGNHIPEGIYRLGREAGDFHKYRIGHPLAEKIINHSKSLNLPPAEIIFDYTGSSDKKITILENLVGQTGILSLSLLTVSSFETEDHLIFTAIDSQGKELDEEQAKRMFSLPGRMQTSGNNIKTDGKLVKMMEERIHLLIDKIKQKNLKYFEWEIRKLTGWADDMISANERALTETKKRIKYLSNQVLLVETIEEQEKVQSEIKELEKNKRKLRQVLFDVEDEIKEKRDELIESIKKRMEQKHTTNSIFMIKWKII